MCVCGVCVHMCERGKESEMEGGSDGREEEEGEKKRDVCAYGSRFSLSFVSHQVAHNWLLL